MSYAGVESDAPLRFKRCPKVQPHPHHTWHEMFAGQFHCCGDPLLPEEEKA